MEFKDLDSYARQMFNQSGMKAIAIAAQRAHACETAGDASTAETWRKVERHLLEMRGAPQS
ncbi:MAG: hypothetical protein AAF501_21570 [Pseudomonadota bacterium]